MVWLTCFAWQVSQWVWIPIIFFVCLFHAVFAVMSTAHRSTPWRTLSFEGRISDDSQIKSLISFQMSLVFIFLIIVGKVQLWIGPLMWIFLFQHPRKYFSTPWKLPSRELDGSGLISLCPTIKFCDVFINRILLSGCVVQSKERNGNNQWCFGELLGLLFPIIYMG